MKKMITISFKDKTIAEFYDTECVIQDGSFLKVVTIDGDKYFYAVDTIDSYVIRKE